MFSDQFVKESDSSLCRHQSSAENKKKKHVAAVYSSRFDVPSVRHAVPTVVNLLPQYSSVPKRPELVPKALWDCTKFQHRTQTVNKANFHQPLLQKRCTSQTSLINKSDRRVQLKTLHSSDSIISDHEGQGFSMAATNSVPPGSMDLGAEGYGSEMHEVCAPLTRKLFTGGPYAVQRLKRVSHSLIKGLSQLIFPTASL